MEILRERDRGRAGEDRVSQCYRAPTTTVSVSTSFESLSKEETSLNSSPLLRYLVAEVALFFPLAVDFNVTEPSK